MTEKTRLKDLTPQAHRNVCLRDFFDRAKSKYDAGQREHGADGKTIWQRPVMGEAVNEVVDMMFYMMTAMQKKDEIVAELHDIATSIREQDSRSAIANMLADLAWRLEEL